ncbi:hypothetical protein FOZ61_008336 [Perkinsus olseni]|uniref:subtilisin n=1 Tax=Perkinsus olseni TaxID=32597 RepID=A0A7J6L559_PEROL|nr:hypothetical protein FOZ61_008336 [Perkinsus olseni]
MLPDSLTPRLSVMSLLLIPLSSVELPLVQQPGSAVVIIADSEGQQVRIGDAFRRRRGFVMKKGLPVEALDRLSKCFRGGTEESGVVENLEITGIQVVHTGVAACPATEDDICRLVESIARGDIYKEIACSKGSEKSSMPMTEARTGDSPHRAETKSHREPHILDYPPNDSLFDDQRPMFETLRMEETWKAVRESGLPRRDVIVAIIDTGITTEHPEFHGKLLEGYDASGEAENSVQDKAGHGTAVAGIIAANINDGLGIAGVADRVKIRPVKVTQRNYSTFGDAQLARGWEAALNFQDIDMIVYAAGGDHTPDREALFKRLLTKTVEKGVIVLTGPKNSDKVSTEVEFALPCSLANQFSGVLCAAATKATDPNVLAYAASKHASFGLLGTEVWSPTHECGNGKLVYSNPSGSSTATAIAAGVVALMQSFKNFTPAEIDRMLIGATEGRVKTVNGTEMDYGSLRPDLAVRKAIAEDVADFNRTTCAMARVGWIRESPSSPGGRANPPSSFLHVSMSMTMLFCDGTSLQHDNYNATSTISDACEESDAIER